MLEWVVSWEVVIMLHSLITHPQKDEDFATAMVSEKQKENTNFLIAIGKQANNQNQVI